VHVTAVELDPAVTLFARAHFSLSNEVIVVNEDALTFIAREQSGPSTRRYDHIIHDVFTGGAEPLELFTLEFLAGLRALLIQDGGTIAIVSFPCVCVCVYPAPKKNKIDESRNPKQKTHRSPPFVF